MLPIDKIGHYTGPKSPFSVNMIKNLKVIGHFENHITLLLVTVVQFVNFCTLFHSQIQVIF
jgi:hypothetical protein